MQNKKTILKKNKVKTQTSRFQNLLQSYSNQGNFVFAYLWKVKRWVTANEYGFLLGVMKMFWSLEHCEYKYLNLYFERVNFILHDLYLIF